MNKNIDFWETFSESPSKRANRRQVTYVQLLNNDLVLVFADIDHSGQFLLGLVWVPHSHNHLSPTGQKFVNYVDSDASIPSGHDGHPR